MSDRREQLAEFIAHIDWTRHSLPVLEAIYDLVTRREIGPLLSRLALSHDAGDRSRACAIMRDALESAGGDLPKAARALGIASTTWYKYSHALGDEALCGGGKK